MLMTSILQRHYQKSDRLQSKYVMLTVHNKYKTNVLRCYIKKITNYNAQANLSKISQTTYTTSKHIHEIAYLKGDQVVTSYYNYV